jgi:hypothetical protein
MIEDGEGKLGMRKRSWMGVGESCKACEAANRGGSCTSTSGAIN